MLCVLCSVVRVGRRTHRNWVAQKRHLTFLGPKFTQFLPELRSLAAGTLFQGLELSPKKVSVTNLS